MTPPRTNTTKKLERKALLVTNNNPSARNIERSAPKVHLEADSLRQPRPAQCSPWGYAEARPAAVAAAAAVSKAAAAA